MTGVDAHDSDIEALLGMSEDLVARADAVGNLARMVEVLAHRLGADDCAVVLIDQPDSPAWVVAATDAPQRAQLPLKMERHPEIREVVRTREPLVVTNVDSDPLFDDVRDHLRGRSLGSALVFPVRLGDEVRAVIRLRTREPRPEPLSGRELPARPNRRQHGGDGPSKRAPASVGQGPLPAANRARWPIWSGSCGRCRSIDAFLILPATGS